MIETIDKEKIERLLKLKLSTKSDVLEIEHYIEVFTGIRHKICSHCSAQIRFHLKQLGILYGEYVNKEVQVNEDIKPKGKQCQDCKKKSNGRSKSKSTTSK